MSGISLLIGYIAQKAGYGTYWAGKTQMAGSYEMHGFDEGCFTPGGLMNRDNPYTDFKHDYKTVSGERVLINVDTGRIVDTYKQHGWYWYPHVRLMNHPTAPNEIVWWPNTQEAKKRFGLNTYDYQVWLYQKKLQDLGIADNTVFIFSADNGTGGYGKNSSDRQKGCHVPLIIYAPGMEKHGEQDVLVSLADILPTIADLVGFDMPADYEINGESLLPFLFTDKKKHRNWLYTYRGPEQLARGELVLKDGRDKWWDVSAEPVDLTSYPEIKEWKTVLEIHRKERKTLQELLPKFDLYFDEYNAPGIPEQPSRKKPKYFRKKKT